VQPAAGADQSTFAQQSSATSAAAEVAAPRNAPLMEEKRMQLMPARIGTAQQTDDSFVSGTERVLAGVGQYSTVPQGGDNSMTSRRVGMDLEWQIDHSSRAQDGAGTQQLVADQHMVALLREASAHTALVDGLLQEISQASPLRSGMLSSLSPSQTEHSVCGNDSGSFAQVPLFRALLRTPNAHAMYEQAKAWRTSTPVDNCAKRLNPRCLDLEGCTEELQRELSGCLFGGFLEVDSRPHASRSGSGRQPKIGVSLTDACVSPAACHRSDSQLNDGLIAVPQGMHDVSLRVDSSTVSLSALDEQTGHQSLGKSGCLSVTSLSMDYAQMMGRILTKSAAQQSSFSPLQTTASQKSEVLLGSSLTAVAQDTDDVSLRGGDHSEVWLAAPGQEVDHKGLGRSGCLSVTSPSMGNARMTGQMLTQSTAREQNSLSPLQTESSQRSGVLFESSASTPVTGKVCTAPSSEHTYKYRGLEATGVACKECDVQMAASVRC
jgi:hypothetical protein